MGCGPRLCVHVGVVEPRAAGAALMGMGRRHWAKRNFWELNTWLTPLPGPGERELSTQRRTEGTVPPAIRVDTGAWVVGKGGKDDGPRGLGILGDRQDRQEARKFLYPVTGQAPLCQEDPKRLTNGTEVCKPVLPLLGMDQVVPALLGGCSLQHCFKQR